MNSQSYKNKPDITVLEFQKSIGIYGKEEESK